MAAGPHNVIGGRGPAGLPFPGSSACSELKAHVCPAGCLFPWSTPSLVEPRPQRAECHQMPRSMRSGSGAGILIGTALSLYSEGPRPGSLWPLHIAELHPVLERKIQ